VRVLHVINSLILAGVEVLVREMVPRQRERGVDVSVAVLKELDSPLERDLRDMGTPFVKLPRLSFYDPRHALALRHVVGQYDIVQANLFPAQLWVAAAAAISERPPQLVTTEQSTLNNRRNFVFRSLDAWMYGRFSEVACNSEGTAKEFVRWLPKMQPRTCVIPNGVPVDKFAHATPSDELRQRLGGKPAVIFVARFESAKDHPTLLKAVSGLQDVQLVLVGDGPLRPKMEALAQELNLSARVHFMGRRSDVPSLLKACNVYVHSSNWEGFGIAAVEAMAAGLPVIASDVSGLAEVVRGAGICFPPGDWARLALEIRALLDSPARRAELIKSGQMRAQEYSIDSSVDAYIRMYERALTAKIPPRV
jgi:glycosyltransferase involved in cell wall biosynthesis